MRPEIREVEIAVGEVRLPGDLTLPPKPAGAVIFAHGSGSSRLSPRNRSVAGTIVGAGLATLLFDLLTAPEAADRGNVFNVGLLAERLIAATHRLRHEPEVGVLPIGYFGASTGAAAALWAAAEPDSRVRAIVSRGGRPDLAGDRLERVTAPTLLIVGGEDHTVLELNRAAQARLRGENDLIVVPGAGHLFEEPGALEEVSHWATGWFVKYLGGGEAA
ncbi:MAG: alpha/beta hydrolase [Actinobacteria bacterium]|nr:MAG: alpha/beta hydrolase [Actinomycetota bacterium]